MDEQDIEIEQDWNQWDDIEAPSGWKEAIERAAQEICDAIDKQIIEELCAVAKNIDNYERAMEILNAKSE